MDEEPAEHKDPVAQTLTGVPQVPSAQVGSQSGGDVIDRLWRLSEHTGAFSRKNTRLANALRAVRQKLAAFHEDVKALRFPPLAHATALAVDATARTADVLIAGRCYRIGMGPAVVSPSLHLGDDVVLNERLAITATCPSLRFGEVATVKETYDDDTAPVPARHDEEQVLSLSETLNDHRLRVGDVLVVDLTVRMALRPVVHSKVEELILEEVLNVGYGDIGGLGEQTELIRDVVELPFLYPDLYREHRLTPSHGVLLYGPPGCGKTLIAKAVVASLGAGGRGEVYFLNIKGPQLLDKHVGETERRIRVILVRARGKTVTGVSVVIFFDEMDPLLRTRGSGRSSDVEATAVPQMPVETGGVGEFDNVVVIGATNREGMIDLAILRPGRLDVKIRIGRPDQRGAVEILATHLTPDLPISEELLAVHGDAQGTVDALIEQVIGALYVRRRATEIAEPTRADGELEILHVADPISGAMLANIVDRAKKAAVEDPVTNGRRGLTSEHLRRAVTEEILENEGLSVTVHSDDWARVSGRRGMPVVSMSMLQYSREE